MKGQAEANVKRVLFLMAVVVGIGCHRPAGPYAPRADVTHDVGHLYAAHFEGPELNNLGRAEIDAMPADAPAVFVIHPTRATDRQVFVRRAHDVKAYAKQRGIADAQVRFDPAYEDESGNETFDPALASTACVGDDNR